MAQNSIGLEVLTAMISPAILISACGALILSTSQRLARIIDRVRQLSDLVSPRSEESARFLKREDLAFVREYMHLHMTRAKLLQFALMTLYLTVALLVATSLLIGLVATIHQNINWIPVSFAFLGALTFFLSTVILLREGRLGIRSTSEEMRIVSEALQARWAERQRRSMQ